MSDVDTSCRKCKTPCSPQQPIRGAFAAFEFKLTGYRCQNCGHWNNLKRRKARKESK